MRNPSQFFLIAVIGMTGISLAVWIVIWQAGSKFLKSLFFLTPYNSLPKIENNTLIVEGLRGASELTTAVFIMEAVVPTSQERKLASVVIGKTKLLYIARGEVRAGVDLERLRERQVKIDGDRVTIQLPSPQILDSKIDIDRSRVYDYDRGFLGLGPDVGPELQTLAQQKTLKRIVAAACSAGVLEEANDRAQFALTQLLATAGYQKVDIKTTPPPSGTCQKE